MIEDNLAERLRDGGESCGVHKCEDRTARGGCMCAMAAEKIDAQHALLKEWQKAILWVTGSDTGTSSKAILIRMLGGMPAWHTFPHDASDLGRCLRLLARFPSWRQRIGEMAEVSGPWAAMTREWDALEKCMVDEVGIHWEKGQSARLTCAMLARLKDAGLRADPHVTITSEHNGRISSYSWKEQARP
jgi:hypothetical protein